MEKVVVALSGGVDSSVAAALLVEQGYAVEGVTLRLWSAPGQEEENRCCTPHSRSLAAELAAQLGIPFQIIDAREPFRALVVQEFLDAYSRGDTPNPCVYCNRSLKWGFLWEYARTLSADYLATGHYARVSRALDGSHTLWKGVDKSKDQSYFLSMLSQAQLSHTLFPLGEMTKEHVREIAVRRGLPSADQPESQDLCFLGQQDYRDFLTEHAPQVAKPGQIVDLTGRVLGQHQGLAYYTIGQRKGLPSAAQALYVYEKDLASNRLLVCAAGELGRESMQVSGLNWIAGEPPAANFEAEVKIRFGAQPVPAEIGIDVGGTARVHFARSMRDITPGQVAAFYQGEQILGGGFIR